MKILFLQPHPDDLELNCGHIINFLSKSKKKHNIKIIAATKGEFGLPGSEYDKFKGKILSRIRERELKCAFKVQGIPEENIYFMGYIDGYVPFNTRFVKDMEEIFIEEKPDVVFAPEPLYTWYVHNDHVNMGRTAFYVINKNITNKDSRLFKTPKLFYYSSICSNYYFPFSKKDFGLTKILISCHKTQFWFLNNMYMLYFPLSLLFGLKCQGWRYAEAFRQVFFFSTNDDGKYRKGKIHNKNLPSTIARIWHYWFWKHKQWYDAKYPLSEVTF